MYNSNIQLLSFQLIAVKDSQSECETTLSALIDVPAEEIDQIVLTDSL